MRLEVGCLMKSIQICPKILRIFHLRGSLPTSSSPLPRDVWGYDVISFMAVTSLVEDFYIAPDKSPMVLQVDNDFFVKRVY